MSISFRARPLAPCLSVLAILVSMGCGADVLAAGKGAELSPAPPQILPAYQARAPRKCASATSAPSVAQAAVMIQCSMDSLADTGLTLIQDVNIEMGVPRKFVYNTDAGLAGIDLNAQVLPLRGSFDEFTCRTIGSMVPAGHSCIKMPMAEAQGWCWKTSFGDWKCKMHEGVPVMQGGMPAPTTY